MVDRREIETDILVIGGGLAGAFASLKAKEEGIRDITLVSMRGVLMASPSMAGQDRVVLRRVGTDKLRPASHSEPG